MARFCLSSRFAQKTRLVAANINLIPRRMNSKVGCSQSQGTCNSPKRPCGGPEMQLLKKKEALTGKKGKAAFVSMWDSVPCDKKEDICPKIPRFDDLYYVESDKAKRCYCQTWSSCPELEIKPVPICQNIEEGEPPPRRRVTIKTSVLPCQTDLVCPKIARECWRKGSGTGTCPSYYRVPTDCQKPLAPYPSFSECKRLKACELPLSECLCWSKPLMCEVWAEYRRLYRKKK